MTRKYNYGVNDNIMQRKKLPPENSSFRAFGSNSKHQRKTSAEIVNEAKIMLAEDGVRLVTTRRPITPREPRRQLYGRAAPPDRPPSAFSLRYLQYEGRNLLSSLEPIKPIIQTTDKIEKNSDQKPSEPKGMKPKYSRKLPAIVNLDVKQTVDKTFQPPDETKLLKLQKKVVPPSIVKTIQSEKNYENSRKTSPSRKSKLIRNNDLLTQPSTDTILEMLKHHNGIKECTDETSNLITGILQELHSRLKDASGSWRGAVLSALYGLVECNSAKVLLSVAKVILAVRILI